MHFIWAKELANEMRHPLARRISAVRARRRPRGGTHHVGEAVRSRGAARAFAGTPPPAAAPPVATISQPISVQAGSGVLLRLPQPAATVMSAEPGVARVQPASPTSLFLMGVAPGRTTVIATTEAGQAIVQYRRDRHPWRRRRGCCGGSRLPAGHRQPRRSHRRSRQPSRGRCRVHRGCACRAPGTTPS